MSPRTKMVPRKTEGNRNRPRNHPIEEREFRETLAEAKRKSFEEHRKPLGHEYKMARLYLELAEHRGEKVRDCVDRRRMLFAMRRIMG